jgi:tRNA threonylcarbamoyladenosine biosynthesis protein TsaE
MSVILEFQYSLSQIQEVVKQLLPIVLKHQVVLLNAQMGSGKTTLVAQIHQQLKCLPEASSPTYAIINEYQSQLNTLNIIHHDWYRIQTAEELFQTGAIEYLYKPNTINFIEWPNVGMHFIHQHLSIEITTIDEITRHLKLIEV